MPPDKRERKVVIGSRSRPVDGGPGGDVYIAATRSAWSEKPHDRQTNSD